jgi:hypothetical protein
MLFVDFIMIKNSPTTPDGGVWDRIRFEFLPKFNKKGAEILPPIINREFLLNYFFLLFKIPFKGFSISLLSFIVSTVSVKAFFAVSFTDF